MGEKLGMIGLGKMGLALARQMRNDGHELFGYDNDPERMKLFEGEGGTPVASSKILAEKCASHNLPMVHGAIAGWYGQVAIVWPSSSILDMIYKGQKTGIETETGTPPFTAAATASSTSPGHKCPEQGNLRQGLRGLHARSWLHGKLILLANDQAKNQAENQADK